MTANKRAESIKHKTAALGPELPVEKQPINCRDFHFVQALVAPNRHVRLPWHTSGPGFTTTHA